MSGAPVRPSRPDRRPRAAGLLPGDEIVALDGEAPRDVIRYRVLTDEAEVHLEVLRGGLTLELEVTKEEGGPRRRGHSALFDQVRTCDNHCEFCFIYQLPPGLRTSLYLKDDDYRLSVPLRELHHPHPLHRGRPRAGRHRGPVAAPREHPRHRPRGAGDLLRNRRRATACGGCGPCSTTASPCTARSCAARA